MNGQETELVEGEIVNNGPLDRLRLHMGNQEPQRIDVQENAMLDIQIATAKRYPRSISQFRKDALSMATLDTETASSCFYSLPRGGKPIEGPSVRLAEICAAAWGHIHASTTIFEIGQKEVIARAVAWDMQSNLRIGVEHRRRITNKNGQRFSDDMVLVTCNAALSIALRNAIFRIIPGAYVNSVYLAAINVARGDQKTLAARRSDMVLAFGKMGITPDRLLRAVEAKDIEDIGLDGLVTLRGYYSAIKDGAETIEACFPDEKPNEAKKSLAEKISGGKKPDRPPTAEPQQAATTPVANEPTPAAKPAAKQPAKPAVKPAEPSYEAITPSQAEEIDVAMQQVNWNINDVLSGYKTISGQVVYTLGQLTKDQATDALKRMYAAIENQGE